MTASRLEIPGTSSLDLSQTAAPEAAQPFRESGEPRKGGTPVEPRAAAGGSGGHVGKGLALPLPLPLVHGAPADGDLGAALPPESSLEATGMVGPSIRRSPGSSSHESLAAEGSEGSGSSGTRGHRTLYLGNLHPFIGEAGLRELFAGLPGLTEAKVVLDKGTGIPAGFGFAKWTDPACAQAGLDRAAGAVLFGQEVRANWAYMREPGGEGAAAPTHVFVGDLSPDVSDAMLLQAFACFPGCAEARVMWDHATGRSRGYGFVAFRGKEEADEAIKAMHGQHIGARRVRCGWAQHKTEGLAAHDPQLLDRCDPTNTNVYLGNVSATLTDAEVRRQFSAFGPVAEMKLYRKGAYGFVRYKHHPDAVRAIVGMNGQMMAGRTIKCSWGRHPNAPPGNVQASLMLAAAAGINPLAMAQNGPGLMVQPLGGMPLGGMPLGMPLGGGGSLGMAMANGSLGMLGQHQAQQGGMPLQAHLGLSRGGLVPGLSAPLDGFGGQQQQQQLGGGYGHGMYGGHGLGGQDGMVHQMGQMFLQ